MALPHFCLAIFLSVAATLFCGTPGFTQSAVAQSIHDYDAPYLRPAIDLSFGPPPGCPGDDHEPCRIDDKLIHEAKLGMNYLTASQRSELSQYIDDFAFAEVIVERCHGQLHVEQRMTAAVRKCVTQAALAEVRSEFRKRKQEHDEKIATVECNNQKVRQAIAFYHRYTNEKVNAVDQMCRFCIIPGCF